MAILTAQWVRLSGPASGRAVRSVSITPDAEARAALAAAMGLSTVKKLRLTGELRPVGREDWLFEGTLGATIVQPCILTDVPVSTRVDEPVIRRYLADMPAPPPGESEMPDDETAEQLPATLDLTTVLEEALSLAILPWPKAPGAAFGEIAAAPPGALPDEPPEKPFAGLSALKARLDGDGNGEDGGENGGGP